MWCHPSRRQTRRARVKKPRASRRHEQIAKRGARALEVEAEAEEESRAKKKGAKPPKSPVKTGDERRERIKLTINNAFDEAQRERSLASLRRRREREKLRQAGVVQPRDKVMREVIIPEVITIQELANRMTERSVDVIKLLMGQGAMHKINDVIDADTAELIVREFGHTPKRVSEADVEEGFIGETDSERKPGAKGAGGHHHGSRRPRQDVAARCHPSHRRCRRRGGRHHPAHRRLSGDDTRRPEDHLHRYAGPRGVHGHAPARRQGDRHRGAGGRRRRRRDAADGGGDQSRQGRTGAADRGHQQDRQARRRSQPGAHGAVAVRDRRRKHVGRDARGRGVGPEADRPRQAAGGDRLAGRVVGPHRQSQTVGGGRRDRGQARARARSGRHRTGAARRAAGRRHRRCRYGVGARARADRRPRRDGQRGRAVGAGRDPGVRTRRRRPAIRLPSSRARAVRARSPTTAFASAARRWAPPAPPVPSSR